MRARALLLISAVTFVVLGQLSPAMAVVSGTTARQALDLLTVAAPHSSGYDRSLFPHWIDADANGCDTRSEVLQRDTAQPVTFGSGCTVATGQWTSWYDGVTWTAASDVDIDHLVPLGEAWASGAYNWTTDQRQAYANDLAVPYALQVVTDNVNESKGDRDPAQWMPPATDETCRYAVDWILVKYRWSLTIDSGEQAALVADLAGTCGQQTVQLPPKAAVTNAAPSIVRYSGADRYQVALNVSKNYAAGVPVVYIAKGTDYPDALSAAPAAALEGGPVLLVQPGQIPAPVVTELLRLQPKKIVVVGGVGSVQPSVFDQLATYTPTIVRLSGADRYAASRAVVQYAFGSGASRIYLATGTNYPDALSASAAAGARGAAVLLVNGPGSAIDTQTADLIRSIGPHDAVIAGGPGSVSNAVESSVAALNLPGGEYRLSGADRYEASRNINRDTFTTASNVFLATGMNFPDALAGGPLAGMTHAPLYEVPGTCVPQHIYEDIVAMNPAQVTILGGPASVSTAVESLTECVNPITIATNYVCGAGLSVTATSPNDFAVDLVFSFAGSGAGAGSTHSVAANSTQSFSGLTGFSEDTTGTVTVSYRGAVIASRSVHVDCIQPPPPPPPSKPANPGDTKNCGDFPTWAAAQAWFNTYYPYYGDVAKLDNDHDGIACESNPGHP